MSRPEDLATLVRDAAPRPSGEFLESLDARVAERFGRPERERRMPRIAAWPKRRIAGGLAAACAAGAIVVVAVGGSSGGGDAVDALSSSGPARTQTQPAQPSTAAGGAAEAARPQHTLTDKTGTTVPIPRRSIPPKATATGTLAPAPATVAPAAPKRRVIRDTELALTTPLKDFADTTDGVIAVSDRFGGIVQTSNIDQTGSSGHASFDLRIPAGRLDDAMTALSRLAHVRSRSAASQDVTAQYLSASERLREAQAERRGILRQLAKADTIGERAALRIRLREVDARLTQARGEVRSLKQRTDYVQVAVTVDAAKRGEAIPGTGGNGHWTPGDALHDAGRILQTAAGIALLMLAIGLPLALLGGLAAYGARLARRRRREAALG